MQYARACVHQGANASACPGLCLLHNESASGFTTSAFKDTNLASRPATPAMCSAFEPNAHLCCVAVACCLTGNFTSKIGSDALRQSTGRTLDDAGGAGVLPDIMPVRDLQEENKKVCFSQSESLSCNDS